MSLDPKGLIPKFVYNALADGVPKRLYKEMVKGYLQFKEEIIKEEAELTRLQAIL